MNNVKAHSCIWSETIA